VASICVSLVVYVMIIVQEIRVSDRLDELERKVGEQASVAVLSPQAACYLAEIRVLKDGVGGRSGTSIDDIECNGRLDIDKERATLHDFGVRDDSAGSRRFLKACFSKGVRWTVSGFRRENDCAEPDDTQGLFASKGSKTAPVASAPTTPSGVAVPSPASGSTAAGGTSARR
jgi:hypothetical protein